MNVSGYDAYLLYIAVKTHFTRSEYDIVKSNGRVTANHESYEKRRDHYLFEKLASKFKSKSDIVQYYVANFAYGNLDLLYSEETSRYNYKIWKRIKESLSYTFTEDCKKLPKNVDIEKLFCMYLGKKINIETLAILNKLNNYDYTTIMLYELYESTILTIKKLDTFIKIDTDKYRTLYEQ